MDYVAGQTVQSLICRCLVVERISNAHGNQMQSETRHLIRANVAQFCLTVFESPARAGAMDPKPPSTCRKVPAANTYLSVHCLP